ncbi:hypothetical protein C8J56DRAFT_893561 [Mycena floridula]|nr:hypothetical protein C8J56DRAFT_893561 [Mycena floridula]
MSTEHFTTRFDFDQPAIIASSLSFGAAVALFILSMLDLGVMSLYLSPIAAFVTIAFHTLYFIIRQRYIIEMRNLQQLKLPKTLPPGYSIPSIVFASAVAMFWTGPLSTTIASTVGYFKGSQHAQFIKGNIGLLIVEVVLCAIDLLLLVSLVLLLFYGRKDFLSRPRRTSLSSKESQ